MKKLFNGIRWIIVIILIIPTFLALVGNGILASAGLTITNPKNPKQWLSEGNAYENSIQFAIDEGIDRTINNPQAESPFRGMITEEEIRETANSIFTPEWVQGEVEPLIDSVYSFLNRETEELKFEIDLSTINERAQNEVSALLEEKMETIPNCTEGQTSGCLPPNLDRNMLQQRVEQRLQQGILPTDKQVITHEDINRQKVSLSRAQEFFSFAKVLPWIVYGAILILTLLIALISPRHYNTFKVPGYLWASAGVLTLLLSFAGKWFLPNLITDLASKNIPPESSEILELIQPPMEVALGNFTNTLALLSLVILALGVSSVWYAKNKL